MIKYYSTDHKLQYLSNIQISCHKMSVAVLVAVGLVSRVSRVSGLY